MKIEKKHIIAGAIAAVSITGALAYLQYKKLMNYCIGFNSIRPKYLTMDNVDIDLFLNFTNKSNIKLEIVSQEYDVIFNDKVLTTGRNYATQTINGSSTSAIGVNVKFNPSKIGGILSTMLKQSRAVLKINMKLNVKLWFFTVNIPYVYETTLMSLLKPSGAPKAEKAKCN